MPNSYGRYRYIYNKVLRYSVYPVKKNYVTVLLEENKQTHTYTQKNNQKTYVQSSPEGEILKKVSAVTKQKYK